MDNYTKNTRNQTFKFFLILILLSLLLLLILTFLNIKYNIIHENIPIRYPHSITPPNDAVGFQITTNHCMPSCKQLNTPIDNRPIEAAVNAATTLPGINYFGTSNAPISFDWINYDKTQIMLFVSNDPKHQSEMTIDL